MSERELREFIRRPPKLTDEGLHYVEAAGRLLDQQPDVVVLLQKVREQRLRANKTFDEMGKEEVAAVVGMAYAMVETYIELKFHVLLTDDGGWKWTDDA